LLQIYVLVLNRILETLSQIDGLFGTENLTHMSNNWMKKPPNRLIAEHFNVLGKPKRSFSSREAALEFSLYTEDQMPYECSFCGKWHNGKNSK
jgi:hypothetical protein